jgi:hypothetical protein
MRFIVACKTLLIGAQNCAVRASNKLAISTDGGEDLRTWTDGVLQCLRRQFTTDEERQCFAAIQRTAYSIRRSQTPPGGPEWDIADTRELIRVQVSHLKSLIARLQDIELDPDLHPTLPNQQLPASAFAWIDDPQIRKIAVTDYTEAHQSLSAGAYKPAAIMAALPKDKTGAIAWDHAQLNHLVDAAVAVGFITDRIAKHGHAARDARDTVHAFNELNYGRATDRESRILLELVGEFAESLSARVP